MASVEDERLYEGKILQIKTIQSWAIRTLVEAIQNILTDANIEFSEEGMKLQAIDGEGMMMVTVNLEANKFNKWYVDKEALAASETGKIIVGVSFMNLQKIMRTINNADILSIHIDKGESRRHHLMITRQNPDKNTEDRFDLRTMDLEIVDIRCPPTRYGSTLAMLSADFQKQIREMSHIGEVVEIILSRDKLSLKVNGEQTSWEKEIAIGNNRQLIGDGEACMGDLCDDEKGGGGGGDDRPFEIFEGKFKIKPLVIFAKCQQLSNRFEIIMTNGKPIVFCQKVADLGDVNLLLAPLSQSEGHAATA